ncbi:methionyl-tRNA formyltransferase [Petrocella sp. FN5]|uniref:methionyl-tRNA formyltransferase n=1 Tax=Petrocella sp. FN5 TaxID=3032002 RepID=UPI0023DAECDE|nr:methionyl-tRNA formyltransferase [Petrocella sp. FN5]MDF1616417.1 methionyl-tRNA formyltransferase [Petrocella sp. FN5]
MRILFMGTPDFSVPTLEDLINSEHEIIGVVTQPDKPKGRGKQIIYPPVKVVALENEIPVYQPNKVKNPDFMEVIQALEPDLAVVIAFGQILPKAFLELPKYGCINIHASLLPKYRGAGPIQWAIIHGEATTGVTTMYMDVGLDTGDMLLKETVEIQPKETGGSLHDKLSFIGGPLILKTIEALTDERLIRQPQNNALSTYAPMLDKEMGNIDWHQSADRIERLVRGLNPWPSAYTHYEGKLLKIWESDVVACNRLDIPCGSICEIREEGFVVKCKDGGLLIKSLQLQGKKRMSTPDFLRGHQIRIGQELCQIVE